MGKGDKDAKQLFANYCRRITDELSATRGVANIRADLVEQANRLAMTENVSRDDLMKITATTSGERQRIKKRNKSAFIAFHFFDEITP